MSELLKGKIPRNSLKLKFWQKIQWRFIHTGQGLGIILLRISSLCKLVKLHAMQCIWEAVFILQVLNFRPLACEQAPAGRAKKELADFLKSIKRLNWLLFFWSTSNSLRWFFDTLEPCFSRLHVDLLRFETSWIQTTKCHLMELSIFLELHRIVY